MAQHLEALGNRLSRLPGAGLAPGVTPRSIPRCHHRLTEFPVAAGPFYSDVLWPFFMARIPSLAQPDVQDEIKRRGIDRSDSVQLLKAFGERTIANPFVLSACP